MFDQIKKLKELEALANDAKKLVDKLAKIDANNNGIPDGTELLQHLLDLPELIKQEASDVHEEVEDAREKLRAKFHAIAALAGEGLEEAQTVASKEIESIKARIESLSK